MAAPAGSVVRIHYDAPREVVPGDAIVTTTGRTYLVIGARRQRRGKHVGRWHLRCAVTEGPAPAGIRRHPLTWYPRRRDT